MFYIKNLALLLGGGGWGSPWSMSIIRIANVTLSILRKGLVPPDDFERGVSHVAKA